MLSRRKAVEVPPNQCVAAAPRPPVRFWVLGPGVPIDNGARIPHNRGDRVDGRASRPAAGGYSSRRATGGSVASIEGGCHDGVDLASTVDADLGGCPVAGHPVLLVAAGAGR